MWDVTRIYTDRDEQKKPDSGIWSVTVKWPSVQVLCRNVISLPTFFPSADKITFIYIKIHIMRGTQLMLILQMDKLPFINEKRGPEVGEFTQNGNRTSWHIRDTEAFWSVA